MTKEFYCPFCGFECVVAFVDCDFDNCECQGCRKVMLETGKRNDETT